MSALIYRERPAAGDARRACSSSTTAAAPTSTTCSASPTCSTRSGGCTSSRRARRCSSRAGRATTGTSCRASATPTPTRSTPPTTRSPRFHDELWERTGIDAGADGVRRLLDGLGDELRARPRRRPPGARRDPRLLAASSRPSRAGSPTSPTAPDTRVVHRPRPPRPGDGRRLRPRRRATCSRPAGCDVEYHESDAAHHIDPAHVPAAVDWLKATLPLPRAERSSPLRSLAARQP